MVVLQDGKSLNLSDIIHQVNRLEEAEHQAEEAAKVGGKKQQEGEFVGKCDTDFKSLMIFKQKLRIKFMSIFCAITLSWMPPNAFDDRSALAQVMVIASWQQAVTWMNVGSDLCRHIWHQQAEMS